MPRLLAFGMACLTVFAMQATGLTRAQDDAPEVQPRRGETGTVNKAEAASAKDRPQSQPSNRVAIQVREGADPQLTAARHGGKLRFTIPALPGWCEIEFPDAVSAAKAIAPLLADADVESAVQQHFRRRARKTNDPYYALQWHLENGSGPDVDIVDAWAGGYTGAGKTICIVDDGTQTNHPDLAAGYNAALSYDYIDNDANPNPTQAGDDHGTAVAGIAVARANNNVGVAGAAYDCMWGAVRLLGSNMTDAMEAAAVTHALADVDIYNNSWGGPDTGDYWDVGPLFRAAIQNGVATGRGGLGAIYVWAAGNGYGYYDDDSNLDGYAAMAETIAVAAINRQGTDSSYSEPGANIMVTAPGGDSSGYIVTTDRTGADGYNNGTVFADMDYTNDFEGTSAATPVVSGVVALMLQANPTLTWRDVQHILVHCADPDRVGPGGQVTASGLKVHERFGFGMVQAKRAVDLATAWINVPPRQEVIQVDSPNTPIPDNSAGGVTRTVTVSNDLFIEHVIVELTTNHTDWGNLRVTLSAPSGTNSKLATPEWRFGPNGNSWQYLSVRHWGESAQGNWTLKVSDELPQDTGTLQSWRLIIHGTDTLSYLPAAILNTSLPDATQYTLYSHAFDFDSLGRSVQWSLGGNSPPGVSILPSGQLSGAPHTDGTYSFTVTAEASSPPAVATANVTLVVHPGTPPTPPPTPLKSSSGGGGGGCTAGALPGIPAGALIVALYALARRRKRARPNRPCGL